MASEKEFSVRRGTKEDLITVRNMIQELADFQKLGHEVQLPIEDFIKDSGLDGGKEYFHCYIAETEDLCTNRPLTRIPVGYALCFFVYSTFIGKSYFMEDLYVKPEYRNKGIGRLLLQTVIRNALEFGSGQVDFHVLNWNPAKTFYDKFGAIKLTEKQGWHVYRFKKDQMENILKSNI